VAWPLTARAQQGERLRRIGVLTYGAETLASKSGFSIFRDRLEQLGWIEGRNLRLDFRFGDGDARKTSALAVELVQLAPDVIVVVYSAASADGSRDESVIRSQQTRTTAWSNQTLAATFR
jgi:putative ABC transport system substrate-binding protein